MFTLKMTVGFVVAGFGRCLYGSVMTSIHLCAGIALTANAGASGVSGSDEFIEGLLGFTVEVSEGL